MSDRSKMIPDITTANTVVQGDLFIVEKAAGTRTVAAENLFGSIAVDVQVGSNNKISATNLVVLKNNTPVSSTGVFTARQMWFDDTYLYIAINSTTLRRVALQAF
jgi:hypothetical protein